MEWPVISNHPEIQQAYEGMRRKGESHRMAEMLALQCPPMSDTDREFLEGHCNGNQFEKTLGLGNYYGRVAKEQGFSTTGKVYLSGLARYPGDPEAWVSGKGDVKRVIEQRGWSCRGAVNIKGEVKPPSGGGIASSLVTEKVAEMVEQQPELARRPVEELRERVVDRFAPPEAKREIEG